MMTGALHMRKVAPMQDLSVNAPALPPVLAVNRQGAVLLDCDGSLTELSLNAAKNQLAQGSHIIASRALTRQILGFDTPHALDVLELFVFTRPAQAVVPSVLGLARALNLPLPQTLEDEAIAILEATQTLLRNLSASDYPYREGALETAMALAKAGWGWGPGLLSILQTNAKRRSRILWDALSEWEGQAPPPPPDDVILNETAIEERLASLLPQRAESRDGQRVYAKGAAYAFAPKETQSPNVVLAEAGTGIGKTLGYVAPASLWAEKAKGTVWIATYTKALQRQIDQELDRLYPDPRQKAKRAVVRKGRENYLCLLNLEEAIAQPLMDVGNGQSENILIALVERWARYSRDGDLIGGDFPAWLGAHFGSSRLASLTDHRGECLYTACRHYRRCFIEKSQRAAGRAQLVIANHALVMVQAAQRNGDGSGPTRFVFDEAHHLFDAADTTFSADLTGQEMRELRRWLLGPEGSRRKRGRGLSMRIGELVQDDDDLRDALNAALLAAKTLPSDGWLSRIAENQAFGPAEKFLERVRAHVLIRAKASNDGHGLEADVIAPIEGLIETAHELLTALDKLLRPLAALAVGLARLLDTEAENLDSDSRARIEGAVRSLRLRLDGGLVAWRQMLESLGGERPEGAVDWFILNRAFGRDSDIGMLRHLIDPTLPFARLVLEPAQGAVITSATLRDRISNLDEGEDWKAAEVRSGAHHLMMPPKRIAIASPYDYAARTKVIVVSDVDKRDGAQVAAAYRALFLASGGGALGLFTAIARLRGVHHRLIGPLAKANLALYAQHVDPIDTGTLIDMFRADEHACLLGTDAVRDGIDVPGNALRLIVFDRVPWPRPTILHRARKAAFGKGYDDLIARLRLTQAFGRLIRRGDDRGVFVMLDASSPSRLFTGLPKGVVVERMGLSEAVRETRDFLTSAPLAPMAKLA